jgi:Protein of unknown function (DUF3108)
MNAARDARRAGYVPRMLAAAIALHGSALAAVASAEELEPFEASYAWSWRGATVAVSTLRLERGDGDTWVYSSSSGPRGLGYLYPMRPKLRSTLRITDQGVQPLSFKAEGAGDSHDADVTFDWSAGRATGDYEGTAVDLPLKPGIQDDLSVQIAMMLELLHGRTPDRLWMIDRNSAREYRYQREGAQTIDTPLGRIDTIVYSSHHEGSPRVTRFWCAPSAGYLPMRVEQKRIDSVEWSMEIRTLKRG